MGNLRVRLPHAFLPTNHCDPRTMASRTLPRRRSMTDAFQFTRNPEAASLVRNDLINLVQELR